MYSYSYNVGGTSMNRLDELLNRNQLIYQNLKQKLDGINRSNQNIYRNISHIQTNFSQQDPLSHESSAIEREIPIRNTSHRHEEDSTGHPNYTYSPLERIDEHQEVTFSEENLMEEEEARQRRILQEEQRLYELQFMLEREKLLEQERLTELEIVKREREEVERQSQREEMMRKIREEQWQEQKEAEMQSKREAVLGEPSERSRKSFTFSRIEKDNKNSIKSNSIYLSKIPKTSIVEADDDEIPTFRESFTKKNQIVEEEEVPKSSSRREQRGKPEVEQGRQSYRGKQLRQISGSKINRVPQEKKRQQPKKEPVFLQETPNQHDQYTLDGSSIIPDPHEPSDLDLEHTIARSEPPRQQLGNTAYSQLNSHFKLKLEEIELVPDCILFAPFNKVYRSPILQLKPGCITLERKSKTSSLTAAGSRMRIVDGLRYKFKTVMTDEQQLLKYLFCSEEQLSFQKRESNKIAIVGGREALKKKLHMGLLAYCHQQLAQEIAETHRAILIKLEHQAVTPNQEPFLIQSTIEADPSTRRVASMKLEKLVNEMHEAVKRLHCGKGGNRKVLRMTKLAVVGSDGEPLWNCSIISSNRYDYDFLRHLRVNKICWSINPLVKYYDDVKETLESMRFFIANRRTA